MRRIVRNNLIPGIVLTMALLFSLAALYSFDRPVPQVPTAAVAASVSRGKALYQQQCIACHQVDGSGVMNMNPPLIKTTYVLGDKPALIKIVLEGMTTPLTIDDNEYHNVMPPHTTLTDQNIADVLTFVRRSFGNKATAVTAAEVKAIRVKDNVK